MVGGLYFERSNLMVVSFAGPPYVPIKVIPPYEDPTADPSAPNSQTAASNERASPASIPHRQPSSPSKSESNVQYPSLPNVGDYQTPGTQNYPQPTYPGQSQYQQRGEVYPHQQPNERSRLLNQ